MLTATCEKAAKFGITRSSKTYYFITRSDKERESLSPMQYSVCLEEIFAQTKEKYLDEDPSIYV